MLKSRLPSVETPPAGEARSAPTDRRKRVARVFTELFAPAPMAAALLAIVAFQSAPTAREAIVWAGVAVLFASLIPIAYILRGVRKERLTDHHVGIREQRPMPLIVGISSVLIGVLVLNVFGAPGTLVALIESMLVGLAVSLAITLLWKMSIHCAVVAGSVVVLVLVFGQIALLTAPVVALVGWSRVQLGDHTPAQVTVGACVGALVAGLAFPLLR